MPEPTIRWWEFALWGTGGGAAVLAIEFWGVMRERQGKPPVRFTRPWYWVGEACRILVGGVLALALGKAQQVTIPLGAFTVGVAAPLILARLGEFGPRLAERPDAKEEHHE